MATNFTPSFLSDSDKNITQLQSSTIDLLRFPLAIMVIFIHMNPKVINLIDADFNLLSRHGVYNTIEIIFSHVLSHIAVPAFYLISGFLFFLNFHNWSWGGYKKKIKSRARTLFIPYILWNFIPFLLVVLNKLGGVFVKGNSMSDVYLYLKERNWHIFYDYHEWGTKHINWLGDNLRMTGPFDLPLWFLRDLIVVTLLTPLIYFAVKKLRLLTVIILFVAYISRIWTLVPGFNISAFFYFTTGSYFALNHINIISFVKQNRHFLIPTSIILLIAITIFDGENTVIGQNLYPFFVCATVFTTFYIVSFCIEKYDIKPNKLLVSSCFFIYALHLAPTPIGTVLGLSQNLLHIIIPGSTVFEEGICYLISPFLAAFFCILILQIARKCFPKITLLFSGNR